MTNLTMRPYSIDIIGCVTVINLRVRECYRACTVCERTLSDSECFFIPKLFDEPDINAFTLF